ncbi:MAG: ureE [Rhizobacter sp.]|nr:ureE [Rhizobacter sp.]
MDSTDDVLVLMQIRGDRADPVMAARLHDVSHRGLIETLELEPADLPRRRFHAHTDRGTPCFVAIDRSERLFDGAVLHLTESHAVIVRVGEQRWLRCVPVDAPSAIELGYLAGNLHWRIRFDGSALKVALEAPRETYLARLRDLTEGGRVRVDD